MAERTSKSKGSKSAPNLTHDLATFLSQTLLPDLTARTRDPDVDAALRKSHAAEAAEHRTADSFAEWVAHLIEQVGAAWVLSCVFVRTLEDRDLLDVRRLAGPGAADSEQLFFELFPALSHRDYLLCVFREVSRLPGAEALLGPGQNPAWRLAPSPAAARALCEFFQQTDEARGLRWRFDGQDTRFLGDLYQDLSAAVRERYALLQTPRFVERFILDLTLEPAVTHFGWDVVRVIDPTCGSGHFLLGAFERLLACHQRHTPMRSPKEHALAALDQIYGADLNPYAVAIARFRLTLAYLEKTGITKLAAAPTLPLHLVVADSLLYGAPNRTWDLGHEAADPAAFGATYLLEDPAAAKNLFRQRFHAVVGNPPYITCKDSALRDEYRKYYPKSATRSFALAAPFTECFFGLATDGGFVGLINANSFMKREFGKKLIEEVLRHKALTRVIDTSGAFIPGHGTPTALLFGRNSPRGADPVRTVQGKRGEPDVPADAEQGQVWSAIARHFDEVGYEDEFISIADVPRETFDHHPWSLGGGGASELKALLDSKAEKTLEQVCEPPIGRAARTGEDNAFSLSPGAASRANLPTEWLRPFLVGEAIRDWSCHADDLDNAIFPYDVQENLRVVPPTDPRIEPILKYLWSYKTHLKNRTTFQGNMADAGLHWYEYMQYTASANRRPLSIAYGEIATHNHFVLDRGGKVFNRTAPIIKLPEGSSEEDHLALLGYLNSSTACFWMKQVCFDKGRRGEGGGVTAEEWERFFAFNGTKLHKLPIPPCSAQETTSLVARSRSLWELGQCRQAEVAFAGLFDACRERELLKQQIGNRISKIEAIEHRIRGEQESLDWYIYSLFGLAAPALAARSAPIGPGARASDVLFARAVLGGVTGRRYFELCRLPPPEVIATGDWTRHWQLAQYIETVEASPLLMLLETPVYKRTFREGFRPLDVKEQAEAWILTQAERTLTESAIPISARELARTLSQTQQVQIVAEVCLGSEGFDALLSRLVETDAVPFLSAYRYSESGLGKRAEWEAVWERQRAEDAGEEDGRAIPVPPKYDPKDFRDPVFYRLRGKLDVPKERFISYPGAERADDRSPVLGWAGWNPLDRARALAELYQLRKQQEGWDPTRLKPLLAGVRELLPWLGQWHNEPSEDLGGERPGDAFAAFVAGELRALGLSDSDLDRIEPPRRAPAKLERAKPAAIAEATPKAATKKTPGPKVGRKAAGKTAPMAENIPDGYERPA